MSMYGLITVQSFTGTMYSILFVCHGNICRSPMAEFVMKDIVRKNGCSDRFHIESCATSNEEIGNDIYPPVKQILTENGIPFEKRSARRLVPEDYDRFDMIICMDRQNLHNIRYIIPDDEDRKISLLLSHIGRDEDLKDPWYTGRFNETFIDVKKACSAIFNKID